jgi:ankyrin repeat protein
MLRLAEMTLAGVGTDEDRVEAHALYSLAASIGSMGAAKAKIMLAAHLDLAQLEESRNRTRAMREMMPPMDLSKQIEKEQDLQLAAAEGKLGAVEEYLQSGVDANAIDDEGRTPMIMAAWRGHHHVLRSLLNSGVDINAADNLGRTALSWAAINGYRDITKTLLREAALVNVQGEGGLTPLMRAAWNGYEEIVADLIANKADVHITDNNGFSALRRATAQKETHIIAMLRAAGAR